jgi:SAM-dependent methyltransferase
LSLGLSACVAPTAGITADHAHHSFSDADAWAKRFEDPARDAWQKPDEVLKLLALRDDAVVADIGAATGYFPVRVARVVPKGHVYGVDVEQAMVDYLAARAEREKLENLTAVKATFDDAKLPAGVDLVMMVNTYHHIEDRAAYFSRVLKAVKPGGRLVIIDFTKSSTMGPPASAKLEPEQVTRELAEAGWTFVAAHDVLPEQFFLVYARP